MAKCGRQAARIVSAACGMAAVLLAGCGKSPPSAEQKAATRPEKQSPPVESSTAALDPRLHQSFADATTSEPPAEWHRPPDETVTHKSVGKLYTEVVRLWDTIRFTAPGGKQIHYRAVLETEMGPIAIDLRPDWAPNHVRSFVALARAGYYDGLMFDRTVHESAEDRPENKLELIEAGCPLGTGEAGYGSIGYWLKPEFNPQLHHEEGTVGASHGETDDSAACKFYINLGKAPFMDGNYTLFGRVTEGIEIAHRILTLPVHYDAEFPEADRPIKPVVIRKVTIQTEERDPASAH